MTDKAKLLAERQRLAERLEMMVKTDAWQRYYMNKDEAALTAAALRAKAQEQAHD